MGAVTHRGRYVNWLLVAELVVVEKQEDGSSRQWSSGGVAFVLMTGEAQQGRKLVRRK